MKKNLPLSPHLQIYKPQITSVLSIAHRITGFSLNLALVLTTIWIVSISLGDIYYQNFVQLFETLFIKFVVYLIVLAFSYHALNGIRHILWDLGYLIDNNSAIISGIIIIISSITISILVSIFLGIF